MRRAIRITVIVFVVLVVVLVVAHTVTTFVLESRYEAALDRIRAAGQPVLPRDLATEPVPDSENLAVGLREASAWLARHHETHPEPEELLSWDQDWYEPEDRAAVDGYLRSIEPYLDLVEAALARPGYRLDVDWDAGPNMDVPLFGQLQEATTAFGQWATYLGDAATRTDRIVRAARVCRALGDRCEMPFVLGHVIQEVSPTYVVHVVYASRTLPGFDAVHLRDALDPLLREEPRGPPARPLVGERTWGLWLFERWRAGGTVEFPHVEFVSNEVETWGGSYAARPLLYLDALAYLDAIERWIGACDVTPAEALARGAVLAKEAKEPRPWHPVTRQVAIAPAQLFREYGESAARFRICRVALALMAHRQTTGTWPATLAELGELPTDPYSGAPFRYENLEDEFVRLWCARDVEWERNADDELAWEWER